MVDPAILEDLARFDDEFNPNSGGKKPSPEALPDDEYELEIIEAKLEKTKDSGDTIFKVLHRIRSGNAPVEIVEQVYFFRSQTNVDILGQDLTTLGFDVQNWKAPSRPFSKELTKIIEKRSLIGVLLKAKKVTTTGKKDGKTYHNLQIKNRLRSVSAPSSYSGFEQQSDATEEEVPF